MKELLENFITKYLPIMRPFLLSILKCTKCKSTAILAVRVDSTANIPDIEKFKDYQDLLLDLIDGISPLHVVDIN